MQPKESITRPTGMTAFMIIWFGQFVSLIGTGMTRFAIILWVWQRSGQATDVALVTFFATAPLIIVSPIAGALVDRWDRKFVMMISDLAAGIATIALFLLGGNDSLQMWHIYVAVAFTSAFESFQWPAYSAAITTMVEKKHYARTSAMMGIAEASSIIIAPVLAASLFVLMGLDGILLIDIITFIFAVGTLAFVVVPQPEPSADDDDDSKGSIWKESIYGFRYIIRRPSLLGLQTVFFFGNLISSFVFVLMTPMVLARTSDNEIIAASVNSALGVGGVIGGILISTWGGPKRRVHGVLMGWIGASILGLIVLGLGRGQVLWAAGAFMTSLFGAMINASNQSIWQAKVPPTLQGRVFSVRRIIAQVAGPVSLLLAGPLADNIFEPALMPDGAFADSFGLLVGVGPGAGMSLMFVIAGVLGALVGVIGYLIPTIRNVEEIIPDHQWASGEKLPEGMDTVPASVT